MNNYTILSKWTNILLIIFVMEVFDMTLKIIHAYHSKVIYIFFYKFFSKRSLWHGLIGHNYGRFNYNRLSVAVSPEEISQVPHGEDWITRETWPDGTGAGRGNGKKKSWSRHHQVVEACRCRCWLHREVPLGGMNSLFCKL